MNLPSPDQLLPAPENKPAKVALRQNFVRMAGFMGAAFMLAACSPQPDTNVAITQATSIAVAPHPQDQSAESTQSDFESLDTIKQRLSNGMLEEWVNERNIFNNPFEWNARRKIADEINADLKYPQPGFVNVKDAVDAIKNASLQMNKTSTNKLTSQNKDSITGDAVTTVILRNDDGQTWIAQELRPDGSIISEAVVNPKTGQTSLTLDFKGERYKNANPHLVNDPRFSKATITTFSLLAQAVLSQQGKN